MKRILNCKSWPGGVVYGGMLILTILLAYLPALNGGFVWDDDSWTSKLLPLFQGLNGFFYIWLNPTAMQQYYPLTGTTFWLDYQLWNFWTLPYHLENLLLHAISAFLFWRLLRRLRLPGAWLAAFLFALHPVMVESVAWITERKNVLSMALYLGALLAYERFAPWSGDEQPKEDQPEAETGKHQRVRYYHLALFLFLCALLAKTAVFPLPAVILLLSWWKRGGLKWQRDIVPALPFFAMSFVFCILTAWLEKNHVGASGDDFNQTFAERCLMAGHAPWFYLGKLLWPANLCFIYPSWRPNTGLWWQWLYPAAATGGLLALWFARNRIGRGPATAGFYFVGTLFPVLGFISAYGMRYSFVWDHWVYLSSLGVFALVAALAARLTEKLRNPDLLYCGAIPLLTICGILTWQQSKMYADVDTLWTKTLSRNPDCPMAYFNWGTTLLNRGESETAIQKLELGLKIKPDIGAWYNLGVAQMNSGKPEEAISSYRRALQIDPNFAPALYNLGVALATQGKLEEAVLNYDKVIQLKPDFAPAHYHDFADAHYKLGISLAAQGKQDEAIKNYEQAIQLAPNLSEVHFNYGIALGLKGRTDEAAVQYQAALGCDLSTAAAQNDLAWILATSSEAEKRSGTEAVRFATSACELTHYQEPVFIGTLAAAYAEANRFDDAMATAQKAADLAGQKGDTKIQQRNQELLKVYRQNKPYRDGQ